MEELLRRAEAGDSDSQLKLACAYLLGENCEKDEAEGLKWMLAAAEGGNATAMRNLALMYVDGTGVAPDLQRAEAWAINAAKHGDDSMLLRIAAHYLSGTKTIAKCPEKGIALLQIGVDAESAEAASLLGRIYLSGEYGEKDAKKALPCLELAGKKGDVKALDLLPRVEQEAYGDAAEARFYEVVRQGAEDGYYECMVHAAKCLSTGSGVEKNQEQAFAYLRTASEDGYKKAIYMMGMFYKNGIAMAKPDPAKAIEYLHAAREKGEYDHISAAAARLLGMMYRDGEGTQRDLEKAVAYLDEAADHGDTEALLQAGLAHDRGGWANQDYARSVACYRLLDEHGYASGTTCLGRMYAGGNGVAKDERKAVELYEKAAKQGETRAMVLLAIALQDGAGVAKDEVRALHLLQQSMDAGNADAAALLGLAYLEGQGTDRDFAKAETFFVEAEKRGNSNATGFLKDVYMLEASVGVVNAENAVAHLMPYAQAGDSRAMYFLAEHLSHNASYEEADMWYRKAAKAGSVDAQYSLGAKAYLTEHLTEESVRWLSSAAEAGHLGAMVFMGSMLLEGNAFVAPDPPRGFQYFLAAAQQGNTAGMEQLGICYYFGNGTAKNPQQAFACFKKLEEHDSLTRWDLLGNCYFTGEGTAVNYAEALRCFERGRDTSNAKWCQFGRGCLYATPERGYFNPDLAAQNLIPLTEDADYRQVAAKRLSELYAQTENASQEERWLRVAADAQDADAQYNLGVFYFNGKGGRRDLAQAELYFRQAARNGIQEAEANADRCSRMRCQQAGGSPRPDPTSPPPASQSSGGCYVATAVYGSYDCAEVWTLRRFRDDALAASWYGRSLIRLYYAVSPTLVRWFGHTAWFRRLWRRRLDELVKKLRQQGVADTPYRDREIF